MEDSLVQNLEPKSDSGGQRRFCGGLDWKQLNAKAKEMLTVTLESGGKKLIEELNAQEAKREASDKGPAVLHKMKNALHPEKEKPLWVERARLANLADQHQLHMNYILDQRCQLVFGQAPAPGEYTDFAKMLWDEEVSYF